MEGPRTIAMREHLGEVLLILALAGGVFANGLRGEFVLDDYSVIVENRQIQDLKRALTCFGPQYWFSLQHAGLAMQYRDYRPVAELSFAADYAVWKLNPIGYHITSVLVHAAASVLVYFLACAIVPHKRAALMAALLFAAHPIHVEAVVWSKARAAPLALLLMLASLLLYHRCMHESARGRAAALYGGSIGCFALALGSKGSAIVLPVLLAVFAWCRLPRGRMRRALVGLLPFLGVAAGFLVIYSMVAQDPSDVMLVPVPHQALGMVVGLAAYLRMLVLPLNLCLHHAVTFPSSPWDADVLRAVPWGAGLLIGLVIALRCSRHAFFALAWLLVTIIPVSNLVLLGRPIAEARAYVPSVGFCLLAGLALYRLSALGGPGWARGGLRKVSVALCALLVVLYSGLTVTRNMDWRYSARLLTDTVAKNPLSYLARNDLAKMSYEQGDVETALEHLRYAVAAMPQHVETLDRISYLCRITGRYGEALVYYRRLLRCEPGHVPGRIGLAITYSQMGRHEEAREQFEAAVRLDPGSVDAHFNFGIACIRAGEYARAVAELRDARRLGAGDAMAHHSLGVAYDKLGEKASAIREYEAALRLNPNAAETWLAMGACYEDMRDEPAAIRCYRKCLELGGPLAPEAKRRLARLTGAGVEAP